MSPFMGILSHKGRKKEGMEACSLQKSGREKERPHNPALD